MSVTTERAAVGGPGSVGSDGPKQRRRRPFKGDRIVDVAWSLAILAGILILGEISAANEWVSRVILPRPTDVAQELYRGFAEDIYPRHIISTLTAVVSGFLLAAVFAILLAGVLTGIPRLERIFMPFIIAFQTLPKIAVAPLVIIWLGFGQSGKILIVAVVVFFPVLINALAGLRIRDRSWYELFESLGASKMQSFIHLRVPASMPYVFAGLRIGIVFALIGSVVAEFVGSREGLGYILLQQRAAFNVAGVFAILLLLMIVGTVLNFILAAVERKVTFWAKEASRTEV